ncbi:MAG TPA: FG-GAP-like repeat-containing protein [Candidatus Krumholzibacteria bacterium]|nr:FG-GAP-like repeat-containing protein [Candidatus Krumholzibacteria bacterium]HPD72209.1 FG-GAP-like repeat-containing protein [Candidatus Krumholzibacteria bacterium]HRY40859.1 FG-GAP-like repeat-containing protein [Candidatus Krumholzibacteria bacterium]
MNHHTKITRLLLVLTVMVVISNLPAMAATEQVKRQAIDSGLVWLAVNQTRAGDEGYWPYENTGTLAATAAAALAFIEEGYLPGADVVINEVNYGDVVGYALNYMFNRALVDTRFGVEYAVYERYAEDYNNDGIYGEGNDQAIYFEPGDSNRRLYTTGICTPVVYALGVALGRDTVIGRGTAVVENMTYAEAMQDLIDWFSFAQVEPNLGNWRGGWRYDANYSSSDNSTAQWGALPLLYGISWGLGTPNYVFAELELWVNYIQNANGGSGYSYPWEYVNVSKTGGLLLQMRAIGRPLEHERVQAAINYINSYWNTYPSGTWYGNLNHPYAMWAVYKGLEIYGLTDVIMSFNHLVMIGTDMPAAPGGFTIGYEQDPSLSLAGDWYSHYSDYLVSIQNANGSWNGYDYWTGYLASAWYINILNAGGNIPPPGNPYIEMTSTFAGPCPWHGDPILHDVHYFYGTPGNPDPEVPPAEDVEVVVTLNEHMTFVAASGAGDYDPATHTVTWEVGQLPDGSEGFESVSCVIADTAPPDADLRTLADVSASNVPWYEWGHAETIVHTCATPVPDECVWQEWTDLAEHAVSHATAWGDYDNDGDQDLLIAGSGLNRLYENVGGVMVEVVGWCDDAEPSFGAVWGDYDSDGDLDLYVVNALVANALYRNEGGAFVRVDAGDAADTGDGYDAAWADVDNDGDLDLYLCNRDGTNHLYRNDGGAFVDWGGVTAVSGTSRGCAFADYDNDQDQDLYVSMLGANYLFRNDGGVYVDVSAPPVNDLGQGKGVAWGDYDNDGDLDLYLVNTGGANKLFRNDLPEFFTDVTDDLTGDANNGRACAWVDYDNDGWLDLFLTNISGWNRLFENIEGAFADSTCGALAVTADLPSWGCAFADYDADGDQDLAMAVASLADPSKLFRNDRYEVPIANWLQIDLRGVASNRFGVGAKIFVDNGEFTQLREVSASGNYLSQAPLTASYGVAAATRVDVTIVWPSGLVQELQQVPVNQRLVVPEQAGALPVGELPVPTLLEVVNYPNPFNPSTTIEFALPRASRVDLQILDARGRLVSALLTGERYAAGRHQVQWLGRNAEGQTVPSGVYFYRCVANGESVTGRMVLLK